jgi:hypothetical protein
MDLVKLIKESAGKIMTVEFTKRSSGERRVMNCRLGVTKHLKGGESTIRPEHSLIVVYDLKSAGYRSIPTEGIISVKIGGEKFTC